MFSQMGSKRKKQQKASRLPKVQISILGQEENKVKRK